MNEHRVRKIVVEAIEEDIWTGDITTDSVVSKNVSSSAEIKSKEGGILAGLPVAEMVFKEIDRDIDFERLKRDGETIKPGEKIALVSGKTRSILRGERTALNFLQRLSGIATRTRQYVKKVEGHDVEVVDTRKTTPNLRILEKYAVRTGGGNNHRMGLYDAVLIKDNHIRSAGSIKEAVGRVRKSHTVKIEVEVKSVKGVKQALEADADIIMLDNMSIEEMEKAVQIVNGEATLEASGNIDLDTIEKVAATRIDVISVGALTHQIRSLDISLDLR
ncbi:MAG: carboxylating nicotinate-nucleotide diphosphorylase [Candidatus Thermoplasmatota archaeon]